MYDDAVDIHRMKAIFKKVVEVCKATSICPHCFKYNGPVKKIVGMHGNRIYHDLFHISTSTNTASRRQRISDIKKMLFPSHAFRGNSSTLLPPPPSSTKSVDGDEWSDGVFVGDLAGLGLKGLDPTSLLPSLLISPSEAHKLLSDMRERDMKVLWMDKARGHPKDMIMTCIPVPPVPIRPSIPMILEVDFYSIFVYCLS